MILQATVIASFIWLQYITFSLTEMANIIDLSKTPVAFFLLLQKWMQTVSMLKNFYSYGYWVILESFNVWPVPIWDKL